MPDLQEYESRREALRNKYLSDTAAEPEAASTGGVDHLALICSDMDATIRFYTEVVRMRLSRIVSNRDDPTSTHIFLDMGGGNLLAFFDFPEHGAAPAVRGIGAMHHVALKAEVAQYRAIVKGLKERGISHSIHGSEEAGSVYFHDPDDILLEVKSASNEPLRQV
jgi:catechol 2,3-dioxygenase-like lactoylglutathione lyase family enzyme